MRQVPSDQLHPQHQRGQVQLGCLRADRPPREELRHGQAPTEGRQSVQRPVEEAGQKPRPHARSSGHHAGGQERQEPCVRDLPSPPQDGG